MQKPPVPRNSKSDVVIPPSFTPDRENSGRECSRCTYIIKDFGDGLRRCSFKCRRKELDQKRKHQHRFRYSHTEDDGFPADYFIRQKRTEFSEIQNEVVNLVGQLDISISKSSSKSMKEFIEKNISLGIRIITDPSMNLKDGFIQLAHSRVNKLLN